MKEHKFDDVGGLDEESKQIILENKARNFDIIIFLFIATVIISIICLIIRKIWGM